jgi:hypothetical protein
MQDQILKPVIEQLQKEGVNEDQIANTIADLTQAATILLYQQALETFSDEDMQKIEACTTDAQTNQLIADLYAQKVGTTPQELLQVFLKKFVKEFLGEHK